MTYQILIQLISGVILFLRILSWVIVVNALLSFIMVPGHPLRTSLRKVTDPVLTPFRHLIRRYSTARLPLDFSPLLAIIAISIIQDLLFRLARYLERLIYLS